jgi:hypothetical protein
VRAKVAEVVAAKDAADATANVAGVARPANAGTVVEKPRRGSHAKPGGMLGHRAMANAARAVNVATATCPKAPWSPSMANLVHPAERPTPWMAMTLSSPRSVHSARAANAGSAANVVPTLHVSGLQIQSETRMMSRLNRKARP